MGGQPGVSRGQRRPTSTAVDPIKLSSNLSNEDKHPRKPWSGIYFHQYLSPGGSLLSGSSRLTLWKPNSPWKVVLEVDTEFEAVVSAPPRARGGA